MSSFFGTVDFSRPGYGLINYSVSENASSPTPGFGQSTLSISMYLGKYIVLLAKALLILLLLKTSLSLNIPGAPIPTNNKL